MPNVKLSLAVCDYDRTRALFDGRVRIEGCDVTFVALEPEEEKIPAGVEGIVERRAAARAAKDWKLSDTLRDEILAMGWMVKDTKDGQKLTPAPRSETAAH